MVVGTVRIKLYTPWVHSLKEKRMVVKSLCAKVRNKFNVSIAEIAQQDMHQITILGIACVTEDAAHADSICDHVIQFIEGSTEGEMIEIERELI